MDSFRGGVQVELGGRQLTMRMSLGAMARAQRILQLKDFQEIVDRIAAADGKAVADFVTLHGLIWAALGDNPNPPSLEWVGAAIADRETLMQVSDALGQALGAMLYGPAELRGAATPNAANPPPASL